MPWFAAYYSEDSELAFQAPDWPSAVQMALARSNLATGRLEALELGASVGPGQLVTIDGRWAFRWSGPEPLLVGDEVWLPGNDVIREEWRGTVTALGSTYEGPVRNILRRTE